MFYVYIMTNMRNGTLYIGHTDDLIRRVWQHKHGEIPGFTSKYGCYRLVWFAEFETRADAKDCEARMKAWRRAWKIESIEKENPGWRDLWDDFFPLGPRHDRVGYQRPTIVPDRTA
jgi:putative endonuclease